MGLAACKDRCVADVCNPGDGLSGVTYDSSDRIKPKHPADKTDAKKKKESREELVPPKPVPKPTLSALSTKLAALAKTSQKNAAIALERLTKEFDTQKMIWESMGVSKSTDKRCKAVVLNVCSKMEEALVKVDDVEATVKATQAILANANFRNELNKATITIANEAAEELAAAGARSNVADILSKMSSKKGANIPSVSEEEVKLAIAACKLKDLKLSEDISSYWS